MICVTNPYLHPDSNTKKTEFQVSKDDLHELQSRLPRHGIKDAICGALFFQFMKNLKPLVPVALSAADAEANEQRVHDLIQTMQFHA